MQYSTLPLLLLLIVVLLAKCAEEKEAVPGQLETGEAETIDTASIRAPVGKAHEFEGTRDTTYVSAEATSSVLLADVRVARRDGYDRVVFEFDGDSLPGYAIEYVNEVTHCASGYPVEVDARHVLRVQIAPAAAHEFDDADQRHSTVDSSEHLNGFDSIAHSRLICDHHGGVEWAIGTTDELPYRSQTLRQPGRIVVDVLHP
jgi:hypothetical protein